jgi:glyoxylase I family protein
LSEWYETRLGISAPPARYDDVDWCQMAGPTVFAPFGDDSPHVGPAGWGINFRVADLDAMVSQLRADGVDVGVDATIYPNGRFAQLHDPEGNPVQLWQPSA